MKEYNDRLEKAVDFLSPDKDTRTNEINTSEGLLKKTDVLIRLRQILEIDKQCSQCLNWHFDFEMSVMEGSDKLICQDCAENIISGSQELIE